MILITMKMVIHPDKRREFQRTVRGMLEPTRVEPGCRGFHFYQDEENKNSFLVLSEWATLADLNNHIRTDGFIMLLALMDLLSVDPPEVRFDTVANTAGMEIIADARNF